MTTDKIQTRPDKHEIRVFLSDEQLAYVRENLRPGETHHDVWFSLIQEEEGDEHWFLRMVFQEAVPDIDDWIKARRSKL